MQWFICPWFFSLSIGSQITGPMWTWLIWSHLPLMDLWTLTCETNALFWSASQGCSRIKLEKFVMRIYPHRGMHPAGCHRLQLSHELSLLLPVLTLRHGNQRAHAVLMKARPWATRRLANGHIWPSPLVPPLCQASCNETTAAPSQNLFEKRPLCVTLVFALLETPASLSIKINSLRRHLKEKQTFWPLKRTSQSK